MGYLSNENNEIIVDAILTRYGREKLAKEGTLGVTKFALADDEVDYALYNTDHVLGTDYYDVAIREMPVLEALPGNELTMKYRLFTVRDDGVSTTYALGVTYDREFDPEIGISTIKHAYSFTPLMTPAVPDPSKTYYIAELVDTYSQNIELGAVIDPAIGITNSISAESKYIQREATPTRLFAVGHAFTFTIFRLPEVARVFTVNLTVGGDYSARSTTFKIYVNKRTTYNPEGAIS